MLSLTMYWNLKKEVFYALWAVKKNEDDRGDIKIDTLLYKILPNSRSSKTLSWVLDTKILMLN